ncbi:hypothetical protein AGABI1DRAFT_34922 [Agaricus bisporus var. burnettii JB137-S8]|uniref:Polysaccharide lyase 14 domain-containing protein n=1 Tax=Agaricus bisporus var. burnettii (strain JB137-S8 / ATCC MYA-4627 / FGSC 10392) TaxID=597362 RepID=K5XIL8_AGABU|nr:uncharacterized protein AGABI1DRAFT_34922 [Agaricus bisporus var. burnettii JB137-S8]EKM83147.1 hypothetical protein AGABI1DRAFT_34922 [Agaricus bisporus var. burnettii JB137-S8]
MLASKFTLFFLAFVIALVSAAPIHHHHRRTKCHRRPGATTASSAGNALAAPTPTSAASPSHTASTGPKESSKPSPSDTTPKGPKEDSEPSPSDTPSKGPQEDSEPSPSDTPSKGPKEDSEPSPSETPSKGPKEDSHPSPSKTASNGPKETSEPEAPPKSSGPKGGSSGGSGGLLGDLFPIADKLLSWTTIPSDGSLPLSDSTFRPQKEIKDLSHDYIDAPDGKKSMKAHYPKGSYNFQHTPKGGFSFYAPGPEDVDLTTAKEATFGYSVYFPEGFDFVKGGKLPGLYGGDSEDQAVSCSGGRRDNGCWSARLMWRGGAEGEFYTYLPPDFPENQKVCNVKPESDCNPTYGASVGRGSFHFATGGWTNVSERVRLNDPGKANGEIELFVNGKSVINVKGLTLRDKGQGKIYGMQMQTFFGGSSPDFASTKNQDVYFSDFSLAIIEKL